MLRRQDLFLDGCKVPVPMRRLGGVLFSALLAYLAFPNMFFSEGCPALSWVALIPFLAALDDASWYGRLGLGALWGLVFFLLLTSWFAEVSVWAWLAFAVGLSLGSVVFAATLFRGVRAGGIQIFLWPSLWVLGEALRGWLFGGFTWSFAYAQSSVPEMIWSAALGGAYLPCWIIVCVNTCLYLALKSRRKRIVFASIAVGMMALNAGWGCWVMRSSSVSRPLLRVALIQPNISREDKVREKLFNDNVGLHFALSKKAVLAGRPNLVVWPETAFPDDILADPVWRPRVEAIARNLQANFLIGSALFYQGKDLNSALLLSEDGRWLSAYYKRHLVPFSEFQPDDGVSKLFSRSLGVKSYHFIPGKTRGLFAVPVIDAAGSRGDRFFGAAICSEEAYPSLFRDLARHGATFTVVLLNDGWFSRRQAMAMHAQNGVFRAVENGFSVLRAANTGRTVAFDPLGRQIKAAYPVDLSKGWALIDVPAARRLTPYARFGDIFLGLCGGFVIIVMLRQYWLRRENKI